MVEPADDLGELGLAPPGESVLYQGDDDEARPGEDAGAAASPNGGDGDAGGGGNGLEDGDKFGFHGSMSGVESRGGPW